jgi:hypothetical protein
MILDDQLEPGLRGLRHRRPVGADAVRTRRHRIARDVHKPHGSATTQQPPIRFAPATARLFAADEKWFAERQITAQNHASSQNPLISPHGLSEVARMLAEGTITARVRSTVELGAATCSGPGAAV